MAEILQCKNNYKEDVDKELHRLSDHMHEVNKELEALTNQYKLLWRNGKRLTMEQIDHYFALHGEFERTCSEELALLVKSGRIPEDNPLNPKVMWRDILMHEAGISVVE